jgi:hypothetical protein
LTILKAHEKKAALDLKADLEADKVATPTDPFVLKSTKELPDVLATPVSDPLEKPNVEQAVKQEIMKEVTDELELPASQSQAAASVDTSAIDATLGPGFGNDLYDKKSPEQRTPMVTQTHHEAPANSGLSQL